MSDECAGYDYSLQGPGEDHLGSSTWYTDPHNDQQLPLQEHLTDAVLADSSAGNFSSSGAVFTTYPSYNDDGTVSVVYNPDTTHQNHVNNVHLNENSTLVPNACDSYPNAEDSGLAPDMDRSDPQDAGVICNTARNSEHTYSNGLGASGEYSPATDTPHGMEYVHMMTSSSFSDLPNVPSPFDNLGGQPQSTPESPYITESQTTIDTPTQQLGVGNTTDYSTHSRTSSFGTPAGVKFIVGGSGTPSSTNSPYPSYDGASPRDSPICDNNSVNATSNACSLVASSVVPHTTIDKW